MFHCLLQNLVVQRRSKGQSILREIKVNILCHIKGYLLTFVGLYILEDDCFTVPDDFTHQ